MRASRLPGQVAGGIGALPLTLPTPKIAPQLCLSGGALTPREWEDKKGVPFSVLFSTLRNAWAASVMTHVARRRKRAEKEAFQRSAPRTENEMPYAIDHEGLPAHWFLLQPQASSASRRMLQAL